WKYRIYPNPVSDQLVIQQTGTDNAIVVDTQAQLQLLDASGRIVKQWQQNKSLETVSVSNLPSGHYTLRIRQAENVQSFRIVVMH
ncbi:MAG TPA: T9SS type A sorting domain-containing protein, partial [Ferruginibacter sp.]|nr:T9SS type A sorting domain-containing protein [Ferruginibacter sp.]